MTHASSNDKRATRMTNPSRGPVNAKKRAQSAPKYLANSLLRPDRKQLLPILDRLAIRRQALDDLSRYVGLDLVQQLHGLDNAQHLPDFHRISGLYERRRSRRRSFVVRAYDRRLHHGKPRFRNRGSGWRSRRNRGGSPQFRPRRRSRRYGKEAWIPVRVQSGLLSGSPDAHFDVAAFQFELGDILLD